MAPRDSGGIYSLPAGYVAVSGETILPSQHNPPLEDIAAALTASLPRNGAAPMTGNLVMGANKITGLAAGTNPADALRFDQLAAGNVTFDDTISQLGLDPADRNVQKAIEAALPAGKVDWFAMDTAPAGWLKANGAAVSRTTYSRLFSAIGTTFGVGDGSTTFNLPDLRGEFMRGWDDGRGVDGSRAFGSAQGGQIQSHEHGNSVSTSGAGAGGNRLIFDGKVEQGNISTQSFGGNETRPRNIALLACIKY